MNEINNALSILKKYASSRQEAKDLQQIIDMLKDAGVQDVKTKELLESTLKIALTNLETNQKDDAIQNVAAASASIVQFLLGRRASLELKQFQMQMKSIALRVQSSSCAQQLLFLMTAVRDVIDERELNVILPDIATYYFSLPKLTADALGALEEFLISQTQRCFEKDEVSSQHLIEFYIQVLCGSIPEVPAAEVQYVCVRMLDQLPGSAFTQKLASVVVGKAIPNVDCTARLYQNQRVPAQQKETPVQIYQGFSKLKSCQEHTYLFLGQQVLERWSPKAQQVAAAWNQLQGLCEMAKETPGLWLYFVFQFLSREGVLVNIQTQAADLVREYVATKAFQAPEKTYGLQTKLEAFQFVLEAKEQLQVQNYYALECYHALRQRCESPDNDFVKHVFNLGSILTEKCPHGFQWLVDFVSGLTRAKTIDLIDDAVQNAIQIVFETPVLPREQIFNPTVKAHKSGLQNLQVILEAMPKFQSVNDFARLVESSVYALLSLAFYATNMNPAKQPITFEQILAGREAAGEFKPIYELLLRFFSIGAEGCVYVSSLDQLLCSIISFTLNTQIFDYMVPLMFRFIFELLHNARASQIGIECLVFAMGDEQLKHLVDANIKEGLNQAETLTLQAMFWKVFLAAHLQKYAGDDKTLKAAAEYFQKNPERRASICEGQYFYYVLETPQLCHQSAPLAEIVAEGLAAVVRAAEHERVAITDSKIFFLQVLQVCRDVERVRAHLIALLTQPFTLSQMDGTCQLQLTEVLISQIEGGDAKAGAALETVLAQRPPQRIVDQIFQQLQTLKAPSQIKLTASLLQKMKSVEGVEIKHAVNDFIALAPSISKGDEKTLQEFVQNLKELLSTTPDPEKPQIFAQLSQVLKQCSGQEKLTNVALDIICAHPLPEAFDPLLETLRLNPRLLDSHLDQILAFLYKLTPHVSQTATHICSILALPNASSHSLPLTSILRQMLNIPDAAFQIIDRTLAILESDAQLTEQTHLQLWEISATVSRLPTAKITPFSTRISSLLTQKYLQRQGIVEFALSIFVQEIGPPDAVITQIIQQIFKAFQGNLVIALLLHDYASRFNMAPLKDELLEHICGALTAVGEPEQKGLKSYIQLTELQPAEIPFLDQRQNTRQNHSLSVCQYEYSRVQFNALVCLQMLITLELDDPTTEQLNALFDRLFPAYPDQILPWFAKLGTEKQVRSVFSRALERKGPGREAYIKLIMEMCDLQ